MKVTVCFGAVRVLVPCGAGDLLVRDLVREATLRFKKATGQGPETWVGVRALRASSGGILDPDDRVRDVADDRETLTAECAAQAPAPRAAQADGASGSSAGTASPDMFRGGGGVGGSMRVPNSESCVEVGAADLEDGANGLQVRRGSEPTLHQDTLPPQRTATEQTKRWSAAVVCRDDNRTTQKVHPLPDGRPPDPDRLSSGHFQRQTNRLSMQFSGPGSGVWLDAADRVQSYGSKSLPRDARREPLGQDTSGDNHRVEDMLRWVSGVNNVASVHPQERPLDLLPEVGSTERAISGQEVPVSPSSKPATATQNVSVTLVKGEKGLGFTITTRDNPTGGHCPIYIKNILPKGAAVTDGRLRAGDRLVSVNNVSVSGLTQQQVVSLLRNTPTDSTVDIVVQRPVSRTQRVEPQQSPQKFTEKAIGTPNGQSKPVDIGENGRVSSIVNAINQGSTRGRIPKSSSKDDLIKDQDTSLQDALNSSSNSILSLRNRLILRLDVPVHDSEKAGLGISVKGKVTVGTDPQDLGIFIKSVLHGGAASRDGRLHTNDQLLSVNGVSLVGQSNAEAMETLRRALLHARPSVRGSISLTIARRTDSMDSLARWKDDTPPNGNESTNSVENNSSQNFNTVIYNTDKENKPTDYNQNKFDNHKDRSIDNEHRGSKKHASIITINNNTSWVSNQSDDSKGYLEREKDTVPHDPKRDSFEWSRLDGWNPVIDRLTGLRNESYYMATQLDAPVTNGHFRPNVGHVHMSRSPPAHHNVIIEEDYGTTTRGSTSGPGESGSESGAGFSRDAVGRRSMSEKRHAAMDAKTTGTYKKIKEIKAQHSLQVGPSLGMRKSSSLESLQTAIQENQRNPRNEPIYARAHPPLKHWLTDGGRGPEGMVRGSPQQSSLSHKKPGLLKSLSNMLRIGKPHKKPETEIYGRSQPGRASEKSLSREALERHNREERLEETTHNKPEIHHSRQSSGERSERANAHAHGAPPYRAPPARTAPTHQGMESAWGPTGHYVNYDEIQQNLNARREKLSEVQIGQMRRQVHAQRAKVEEESRRVGATTGYHSQRSCRDPPAPRPQSNYYEYESAAPKRPGKLSHYH
ncbi:partitioning defective 3 homolog isoform X2 [Leguminivora glycinivorella]|uniref:partitioning defective 3 homolog isoform X2 n=1 Tax=Leguminivora glycinivorella TaxID=1035111 RepID=UPI00200E9FF9|nr:partitioning defective 3 homolog isoform X2 [Leguminivora glycinivorella]